MGADAAVVRRYASGLLAYDYDLLVSILADGRDRHDVIEWIQSRVIPLSTGDRPAFLVTYPDS